MDEDTPGERFARAGLGGSRRLEGMDGWPLLRRHPPDEGEELMPAPDRANDGATALMRMVDFRIPLPWLLSGFIVGISALVAMYYQLQRMDDTLREMRATMTTQTEILARLTSQQALAEYRLQKLEAAAGK